MLMVAVLLSFGQSASDPGLLVQMNGEREYWFCGSFTDPFPEASGRFSEGVASRQTKVVGVTRLKAGSRVLVAGEREGYAAIFDPQTGTEGCVLAADLTPLNPAPVNDRGLWMGNWEKTGPRKTNKDSIAIRPGGGNTLRIAGAASWKAFANGPDGSTNFGEIDARGSIRDGIIELDIETSETPPSHCRYSLQLIGGALLVRDRDSEDCNGANVSFSGVYHRVSRR